MSETQQPEGFEQNTVNYAPIPAHLREMILAAWGSARDQLGSPNNHRLAELLYKALYHPDQINDTEIVNRDSFDRTTTLTTPLAEAQIAQESIPSEEEFIQTIRRALTSEANFDEAIFEGAKETIANLSKLGPVRIWTSGDVHGQPESHYRGSHEQYKRIAIAGFNDLRKQIGNEQSTNYHEVISVAASENKFELLPNILSEYQEQGIDMVVILEDRARNLEKAMKVAEQFPDLDIFPVWVRQGIARDTIPESPQKSLTEWERELHAVNSIKNVLGKLHQEGIIDRERLGFIVDYDDVISNDNKRQDAQVKSVANALRRKGWIK